MRSQKIEIIMIMVIVNKCYGKQDIYEYKYNQKPRLIRLHNSYSM